MILPTIHDNGTGQDQLVNSLRDASRAIDKAYDALKACAPNGRDYYPQGPQAFALAILEHLERLNGLGLVKASVDEFLLAVARIGTTPPAP